MFLEISPEGKVPVLKYEDGTSQPDFDAITQYLEEKFPNPSLVTPAEYSSMYFFSPSHPFSLLPFILMLFYDSCNTGGHFFVGPLHLLCDLYHVSMNLESPHSTLI
jgi:Glutathione S-transferase, N-terminal domain